MAGAVTPADDAARLAGARRAIATAMARGGDGAAELTLGSVALRRHQREAVARLRSALDELGGALLADDAGLGKTYVALALAREARAPVVVLPAALRATWRLAMERAGVPMPMLTHEALSRGRAMADDAPAPDLVIVDEAHHARNPATRRWRALAALTRGARVLLLSATPVHNRREDLVALLSLFLGVRARDASDALLARCVVRRERADLAPPSDDEAREGGTMPTVAPVRLLALSHDDRVLDALAVLPPPLGAAEAAGAEALLIHALVRQWASSEGALRAALTRRLTRAAGLEAALREGYRPDRAELARWAVADDAVQLPFAALLAPPEPRADALLRAVLRHAGAVQDVLARLGIGVGSDAERAARLLQVRARHAGERVVAFTSYAGTVRALWRLLRGEPGIAALTSKGGAVAGGPVTRADVLARFAPRAQQSAPPSPAEHVSLLLATDLASEGVNLQDASVVVHLDLPWTPARLEQRVGRVARIGAARDIVHVYAMLPPAAAERVLALEARLRAKLATAARAVGVAGAIVPPIGWYGEGGLGGVGARAPVAESAPRLAEQTWRHLAAWRAADADAGSGATVPDEPPRVAAAIGAAGGSLLLVAGVRGSRLLAVEDGEVTAAPDAVARVVRAVHEGQACGVSQASLRAVLRQVDRWLRAERAARLAAVEEIGAGTLRRRAASRAASTLGSAPREGRARAAREAAALLRAVVGARGAGEEAAVRDVLAAADEPLMESIGAGPRAFDTAGTEDGAHEDRGAVDQICVVVLLLPHPAPA